MNCQKCEDRPAASNQVLCEICIFKGLDIMLFLDELKYPPECSLIEESDTRKLALDKIFMVN